MAAKRNKNNNKQNNSNSNSNSDTDEADEGVFKVKCINRQVTFEQKVHFEVAWEQNKPEGMACGDMPEFVSEDGEDLIIRNKQI